MLRGLLISVSLWWVAPTGSWGLDHVTFLRGDKPMQVSGKIVTEAEDGGLLLMDRAGVLWAVTSEEKSSRSSDAQPFELFGKEALAKQVLKDLPSGFRTHHTTHYLIAYNTSQAYAQWCGALFERLFAGFTNYWQKRGFQLMEPTVPLVALVFDDKDSFVQYGRAELGEAASAIIGYFSLATNRRGSY